MLWHSTKFIKISIVCNDLYTIEFYNLIFKWMERYSKMRLHLRLINQNNGFQRGIVIAILCGIDDDG